MRKKDRDRVEKAWAELEDKIKNDNDLVGRSGKEKDQGAKRTRDISKWYSKKQKIPKPTNEVAHENIGLKENLIRLSVSIGMNNREIRNFLDSNKGVEEVLHQENLIRERNISGVPTYIINDKYLLQGGQEAETIVSFLQRIVEKDLN